MFKLDDLLRDLGDFGPYQKKVFAITCTIVFFNSWVALIPVFIAASVDHWCAVPEWDSYDCSSYGFTSNECKISKRNGSIPSNYTSDGDLEYAQCKKYNVSGVGFWPGIDPTNYSGETMSCDGGWVYDDSQYKSSIVTDFDLVCGKGDLAQVSQSLFFGGYLLGSLAFGSLADIIGRWWTILTCLILRLIVGIALAFSPSWEVFSALRFIHGAVNVPIYTISFVIANEFTGTTKRNISGIIFSIPFAVGYMFLALVAYFLPYWRTLEIVASVPTLFIICLMWFLPESVRWQISREKYKEAEKTLQKLAKSNNKTLSSPLFSEEFKEKQRLEKNEQHRATALDLFRTPKMRLRTINLTFNWMVNSVVYFGLSLGSSYLGVNDYVAFAISGAVEIPSYFVSAYIIEWFGRPRSLCGCLLLSGAALLATSVTPSGAALTTVATIGKFGISAAFGILFLFSLELYPTSIRSAAMGAFMSFSQAAGIVAPLLLTLSKYWDPLPMVIFGAAGVAVGISSLFLPETRGVKLPDTLEEGENFGLDTIDEKEEPTDEEF